MQNCFFLSAFLALHYKLDCFDKFPKAEVKWSFVLKWVTWRVNAQRSEAFLFPIWKESPELLCPLRAPQKKGDWLSMEGRKAWQSMPKESREESEGMSVKTLAVPSRSLAPRAPACQTRRELNWKDHTKSLKCLFFSARIRAKLLHLTRPRRGEG